MRPLPEGIGGSVASVNLTSIVDLVRQRALERNSETGYTFLADGEAAATHLTFAEVDRRARAIGALLQQSASPGERALLLFPPGSEFISAFFGCLYAGVIAVPAYPPRAAKGQERLSSIARDSRPRVVLTTASLQARAERLAEALPELRAAAWRTTDDVPAELAGEWVPPALSPETLAFLQYTSGSTAAPKGVMVSHGNLLHNEEIISRAFRQSAESVIVGWLPLYHDMGLIGNVLQPLYLGARCILMSPLAFLQRPLRWLQAISRYRATTSGGPNFAYDLCVRKIGEEERRGLDLGSWQVAFNGAEPVRADTLDRFAAAFAPHGFDRRAFFPCYGLAEGTLFVTGGPGGREPLVERFDGAALEQGRIVPGDGASSRPLVSCGRTWEGLRIVDPETGRPCLPGQVGEIWIQGPSVAQGYWNLTEETERSFHAVAADGSGPHLRTGDLGFHLGDELFVTGRAKDLIILRGRNLYPQDLELSAERSHPALRPGCGAAFSVDVGDEERLVLVHELERGAEPAAGEAAAAIRGALAEDHEVQTYEVVLLRHDSVPKTSSGKIQRHACRQRYLAGELAVVDRSRAEGDLDEVVEKGGEEDRSWRERAPGLRRPWLESYLGRELSRLFGRLAADMDPEQPLTRLGLDSLGAVELQHSLETGLGVSVGLAELLEGASLRQLAENIEQRSGAEVGLAPLAALPDALRERAAGYPLTHNQRALWFLQRLQPQSTAYSIVAAAEVEPALDTAVLRRALDLLAARHEALRLGFTESEAGPVQQAVAGRTVELAEEDTAGWSAERLAARLDEIAHRPFDLERDPLLRLTVFRGASCVVLLTAHHIILDLWSLALLVRDLGDTYTRLLQGEGPPDGATGPRFTDYVVWQEQRLAGERSEALWSYWREKLAGELPLADLPADRPRPPVQSFAGGTRSRWLERGFLGRVQEMAGAHHATLYTLLLAAFQALLHRLGGHDDLLVGSPTAGREGAGTAGLVGLFVNSIVLRSRASAESTFDRFLAATRQTALEAFAHQDYPFPLLVERLQPQRHPGASPLFQVMFALQRSHLSGLGDLAAFALGESGARLEVAGLQLLSRRVEHRAAQFDLELIAAEGQPGLGLALSYSADLFDATTAERILGGFEALLRGVVEEPGMRIPDLPLIGAAERQQLLVEWNDTAAATDHGRSFPALFEEQVQRTPGAPAVSCAGRELTYAQLDDLANRMARGLLDAGLDREDRVALWAEREIEFLAAMIAVFKAGGAYLPLDPRQPPQRLVQMVRSSGARLVLTSPGRYAAASAALAEREGSPVAAVLRLDELPGVGGEEGQPAGPLPGQLAYVLFTSGSTGVPKAAMIEHRNLLNHLWSKTVHPPLTCADRVAQTATATFDISIWQFLAPLLVGGSVHVVPDEVAGDPPRLLAELSRERVTVLETVPSLLWSLVQESEAGPAPDLSTLRWLIPTGEALPPELCRRWLARFPHIPLLNAYGPTECADDVSVHPVHTPPPEGSPRTPIGRPVENLRLFVLDGDLAPAPIGVPGELFVAGAGVGRGYFGDPARTAAVFIPDPYAVDGGGRLYRTGDIALRRPDGLLDFLGRGDHQVKVRGFRIELGEVEAALCAHPGIAQAVVLAYPDPRGDKRLAAFWTAEPGASATAGELRQLLRQSLPDAMLPAAYVQLAAMPLSASGKVDRRSLPEPDWSGAAERPPAVLMTVRDEIEEMIAGVFARVLGREHAGPGDDFFELGGHSLLATQVTARLRQELGVELPLQALFEAPTPAGLALRVRSLLESSQPGDAPPPLQPSPRGSGHLPLSFAQQRLWFLHELDPASPAYNMPGAVRLRGRLRIEALAASLEAVAGRHEALRTVFRSAEGIPRQVILPRAEVRLPLADLAGLPEAVRDRLAGQLAAAESRRPFDLSRGPLFRAALLRLGADDHLLLFTLHHIVSDGWSQGVLVRDMSAFYEAFLEGERPELPLLPPLPVQYADFALWQREWLQGERVAAQIAYWRIQLSGEHAALELPLDRPRPPRRTDRGARRALAVPAGPALELARLSRLQGGTPFMGLVSLVAACLQRYSGQERIHVGSPVANRRMAELEGLIGFFVNTLVLRADFGDDPSLLTLLARMRRTALEAYMHQDVPFERLVEELQPERDLSRSPLFQAMFVLQNAPAPRLELPGLSLAVSEVDNGTAKLELTLSLEETGDGLLGWIEFNSDLFDGTTAERIGAHFGHLLAAAAASPETPLAELPLLGESGRFQLLTEWNDTRVEIPREALVHRLVAAQAERTPDAVAVSGGGVELTYGELTRRAGRLARTLRAAGVAPDMPVGIFAERSCEMVVGVLAILEAGGAYLPLDPLYPRERLAAILDDSGAAVVLAQEHLAAALPPLTLRIVPLGADLPGIPVDGPQPQPGNLAYVLFTSGSTGRPKGVQVPHRALVSLLTGLAGMALGGRTLLSVTTLAFDIASVELFLPLTTGGRVVLADRETVLDGARLAAEAGRVQADLLQATPATWRMLAEAGWSGKADLTAITTGEAVPRDLAEWLRSRVGVLWNLYGPTETTVFSSFQRVGARDGSVPIGRPVANTRLLILDRDLAPVPPGVVGELYIGGAGVARGYAGRPDLTAERFIPDPLGAEPGERLYRTGDLCRHLADGSIEYLGRGDHQVKLRGFRIELPEIEAVLASHPAVEQAVVAVRETPAGDRRLVAWFVASGPEAPGPGELRDLLKRHLPDYMVPAHYVRLDAMPLTSNGKVDRRALPDPVPETGAALPSAAPRGATEEILAEILARVLGLERLDVDENFFEHGGHSLLATRVMSRVNATFAVDLPLRTLFETPTVAGLAQSIATARQARQQPPLRRIPRDVPPGPLAVSFAQEQLWLMEQLAPGSAVYNVFQALRITGPLAAATLESSLVEVIRRHEALRTRITTFQGRPVQVIDPEPRFALSRVDLSGLAPAARESEVSRLAQAEARRPFRLAREPLVRGLLLLLGADAHVLLLAMHHIISDDWSIGLLVHEVGELYQASLAGRPAVLPELSFQYADYAQWQCDWMQGEVLDEELAHWGRRLGPDLPVLDLPTDRPRPPRQSFQGAVEPFAVPAPLAAALRQLGRDEGATLFMVLLAGFAAVLGHSAGQKDLIIGTPVAGRTRPEIEPLIGFFINLLPLRLDLSGRPAYRDLLARARDVALDAYGHQGVPFEKLVDAFLPRRDPSRPALRQVALSVQESSMRPIALGEGLRIEPIPTDPGVSRLDLTLFLGYAGEGLAGYCEYDSALFDRTTILRLLDFLRLALEDMAADPGRQLLALPPLIGQAAGLAANTVPDTAPDTAPAPETNLTPGQLLFWFAPKLQPGVQLYFDRATTTFTMEGDLDERCFEQAFRRLVELCDTLRTRIVERGGIPQRVVGAAPPDPLERVDLSSEASPEAALAAWLTARTQRAFDLSERLFDAALLRLGPGRFVWFFDIHHIGADAGSLQTLAAHLSHLYDLARQDRLDEGLPLPSFDEYAAEEIRYSASESYQAARRYWETKLARSAGTNLFYRRPGTPYTTRTERISFDLGRAESDRVRMLVAGGGLFSPAVVFVSALFALLYRVHGDSRLRIGTSFSNRPHRFRSVVGLMMNTCPLQIEIGDGETFRSLLRRVQAELVETSRHQRYPVRNPVGERAYNVYINHQTMSYTELCGLPVRFDLTSTDHSNDHLNVQVSDFTASGSFRVDLDFNLTAFAGPERVRTAGHFRNLLAALLDEPDAHLASAPMLSPAELQQIGSPDERAAEAPGDSFADLFAAQVERTPDACAASCRGERITYRQLAERADGLARRLQEAGSGPEVPIALLGARNLDFLAALLAIVRTGGVYLPLDPHHPPQRLVRILETSGAPLILASASSNRLAREVLALLPAGRRTAILPLEAPAGAASAPLPSTRPGGLAYILFTSGSTGKPKGVMVAWPGVLNHLRAKILELGLTAADVVAQNASQSFDISVWQFLAALLVGGRVHIVDEESALDAAKLLRETSEEGVTVLEIVPSLLAVLLDTAARRPVDLSRLRWLVPTGEALPAELCRRWFALYPGVPMLNAYGPTECSDDVTHHPIPGPAGAADLGTTPIGRPLPGVRIHVVDRNLALLPVGLPGELCVGGICVGRGYLLEPDRTADAFRPDPFAGEPGARLYRTGDLGRMLEDGTLEFLGRIDHQVKVRGFRIELGEIESALMSFPGLREAVVLAREDRPTDRRLVAYYVPEPGWGPTAAQLRGFLSSKLPEYMVPAAFVALESMPLTPNGKVDRRALPPPDTAQDPGRVGAAVPSSPLESLIASICSLVLRVEPVGVHDNFFELGGNSLLATQVVTQIQEILPVEIDLRHLFEAPTVSKLAAVIDARRGDLGEQERALWAEILADYEQMSTGSL
jgi:amino acid adenylation domain-containing protein